jgi:hypothetical protein
MNVFPDLLYLIENIKIHEFKQLKRFNKLLHE